MNDKRSFLELYNYYIYYNYDAEDYLDEEHIKSLIKQEIEIDYELKSIMYFERKEIEEIKKEQEFYELMRRKLRSN